MGAHDSGHTVDQVDDVAVLRQHDPVLRHPGLARQLTVGQQVAPFAVDRHDAARLDDVVRVQQLGR